MLSHFELSELMQDIAAEVSAAELHGFLCGLLCVSAVPEEELWQEFMDIRSEDDDLVYDIYNDIRFITEEVSEELRLDDFSFQLMLPNNNIELAVRVQALSEWCNGFLNGFGTEKEYDSKITADSCHEVLDDFTKICHLWIDEKFDNEDEVAYIELVEYVRIAVIIVFEEISSQAKKGDKLEIIH